MKIYRLIGAGSIAFLLAGGVGLLSISLNAAQTDDKAERQAPHGDGHKDHEGHEHETGAEKDHEAQTHEGHGHKERAHQKGEHEGHSHEKPGTSIEASEAKEAHGAHKGHGEHESHRDGDEHAHGREHRDEVKLTIAQMREFGIKSAIAAKSAFITSLTRSAEVKFDQNRLTHIVSRVPGIASRVIVSQGDKVASNQLLAVLDSLELSEVRAGYIAASESEALVHELYLREKDLEKRGISRLRDVLETNKKHGLAKIEKNTAAQKLLALGFPKTHLDDLTRGGDSRLSEYRLQSPIAGTVIERNITRGEAISRERDAFVIADLSHVWVDITLYSKDLAVVRKGQRVEIAHLGRRVTGRIAYVSPHVNKKTRTAIARLEVANESGDLRPGSFLEVKIETGSEADVLSVPKSALQMMGERQVIFVAGKGKYVPRDVKTGRESAGRVELISGLKPGEVYVTSGAFTLKAQLSKESFGDGHNH